MAAIVATVALVARTGAAQDSAPAAADRLPEEVATSDVTGGDGSGSGAEGGNEASAPVACVPACRDGFMCHSGICVSKCNPPCDVNQTCTDAGECIPAAFNAPSPPIVAQQEPWAASLIAEQERRNQARQVRLEYRKKTRLTLYAMFDVAQTPVLGAFSGGIQVGVKRHLVHFLALQGRASLFVGATTYGYDAPRGVKLISPRGDVSVLFGPFGRFYAGLLGWMHGLIAAEHPEYVDDNGVDRKMKSEVMGGPGAEMGVLFGAHEHIDLNMRIKGDIQFEDYWFLEIGIGFHIFPGDVPSDVAPY
ncbi:MAG: hypothetical protein JXR45_07020 [Deltaproteobacteria bacterium]|nr:hypothetical protein [Deltaproteobacteria bacterium]